MRNSRGWAGCAAGIYELPRCRRGFIAARFRDRGFHHDAKGDLAASCGSSTATYGVPLSKAYEMHCQRRSGDPTWGDAPIIEQKACSVPQTTDIPHVIDLDRYYESPAAACVALGIPSRNRSSQS